MRFSPLSTLSTWQRCVMGASLLAAYAAIVLGARLVSWQDAILISVTGAALVSVGDSLPARTRFGFAALGVFVILTTNVLLLWRTGYAGRNHIFLGEFPLSDAGEYYGDAVRVLHGSKMGPAGSRRPLSVSAYGVVLRLMQTNVRATLLVFTALWSLAVAAATAGVWRTHGRIAATIMFVMMVMFARRYAGLFQSEGLGGPLGALGFALIWRAAESQRPELGAAEGSTALPPTFGPHFASGLFLITLALIARPGPYFLLLGLVAWAVCSFRNVAAGVVATQGVGAFLFASLIAKINAALTTSFDGASDLPAIVYGMLRGEEHYALVRDNPSLLLLEPAERYSAMWSVVRRTVLEDPGAALLALPKCFVSYFYLPQGIFGFVWNNADDRVLENGALVRAIVVEQGILGPVFYWVHELGALSLINAIVMGSMGSAFLFALVIASFRLIKNRRTTASDPFSTLLRFALAGLAVSMFVLPPWVTEAQQMYAAAFSFFVAIPAIACWKRPVSEEVTSVLDPDAAREPMFAFAFGALLIGAIALVVRFPLRASVTNACGPEGVSRVFVDWRRLRTFSTRPESADLKTNLELLAARNPDFASDVRAAGAREGGAAIVAAYDYCTQTQVFALDATSALVNARGHSSELWLRYRALSQPPLVEVVSAR